MFNILFIVVTHSGCPLVLQQQGDNVDPIHRHALAPDIILQPATVCSLFSFLPYGFSDRFSFDGIINNVADTAALSVWSRTGLAAVQAESGC